MSVTNLQELNKIMDKKQRKANEALKKSRDYLKAKEEQKIKVQFTERYIPKSSVKKSYDSWVKKHNESVCDVPVNISGKEKSFSVAIMNMNLAAISIQGKKSMLLKGQCVINRILQTETGVLLYAVFAADGRYAVSFYNPTNSLK